MNRPEQALQIAVAQYLDAVLSPDVFWCHVPNQGKRGVVDAVMTKRMGRKAGVPDILIVDRGRAVFIELKADKGKLSLAQQFAHGKICAAGAPVAICRSLDDVEMVLVKQGIQTRGRL